MMHKRTDEFLHREGVTAEQAVEECDFLAGDVHFWSWFLFCKRCFGPVWGTSAATAPPQTRINN